MDGQFVAPTGTELMEWTLRYLHVLFGIAWIGMLYFFNLVNGAVMKELDGPTKTKLVPVLMPKALWLFRWAALGTWVFGVIYYAVYCMNFGFGHAYLGVWLVLAIAFWGIMAFLLSPKAGLHKDGRVLGAIFAVHAIVFFVLVRLINVHFMPEGGQLSSHVLFIGYGGGLGTFMFLNVWGIIWRNQKRIIAWARETAASGTPAPPEAAVLGREAFLASRTNTWLSLPMLVFMILAGHGKVFLH